MNSTQELLMRSKEFNQKLIFLAATSFAINELLSRTQVGTHASLAIFLFAFIYILLKPKHTFTVCFALAFLIQEFPRDVLLDYTNYIFETIRTVKVGPATLFLYLALLAFFQGILRNTSLGTLIIILLANTTAVVATASESFAANYFNPGLAASNYKIILFTSIGLLCGREYLVKYGREQALDKFMSLVVLFALVTSIRAILNLALEIYNSNIFVFELGTEPLYLFAAMLYTMQREWPTYSYPGYFTTSRAEMVFLVIGIIAVNLKRLGKLQLSTTLKIAIFTVAIYLIILETVPFIIDFFLWKLREIEVFGGPQSGSSIIRQHEILNILCAMQDNPMKLLFGGGLNATYNFACLPLPSSVELEEKSFSYDQIISNAFYGVHSTPAALLLRFGLLGILLTVGMASVALTHIFKRSSPIHKKAALALMLIFSLYYFHSQTHAQLILGFLISCVVTREQPPSRKLRPANPY